jgi:hypothetical protein
MPPKREIKAIDVVADMRAGMTDPELMQKYRLSVKGLQSIFKKLLDADVIGPEEVVNRNPMFDDTANLDYLRLSPRHELVCLLPIYQRNRPQNRGTVCDMTETSVGVTGIKARVNDVMTFVVPADEFFTVDPFSFEGTCRWVREAQSMEDFMAGFEVTSISETGREDLTKLLRVLKLHYSDEP